MGNRRIKFKEIVITVVDLLKNLTFEPKTIKTTTVQVVKSRTNHMWITSVFEKKL